MKLFLLKAQLATTTPPEEGVKEMTEAEREKVTSYEEAFEKIYEETGVNTMQVGCHVAIQAN